MNEQTFASNSEGGNQEKQEKIKRVIQLFEAGLDSPDCIGYHGTSLEAMDFLIEHGHLPGGGYDKGSTTDIPDGEKYLYFFPKKSEFSKHELADSFLEDEEILEETKGYSQGIAGSHYLLKKLGLNIDDQDLEFKARCLTGRIPIDAEEEYQHFIGLGINEKVLDKTIEEAKKRRGVILVLSKKVLESHVISNGDEEGGDLRILIPEGLTLEFLSGIEPVGQEEYRYFATLQKQNT